MRLLPKRPCSICRKWFHPNPRVGEKQKVCSKPECQRERHRRNCASWNKRNASWYAEDRLSERIRAGPEVSTPATTQPFMERFDWEVIKSTVGWSSGVILEQVIGEVAQCVIQDEILNKPAIKSTHYTTHAQNVIQDEIPKKALINSEGYTTHAPKGIQDEIEPNGSSG